MFRRKVRTLEDILQQALRENGLETPLLQRRLIDAWPAVVGKTIDEYTGERFIKNQTLFVKILNPALRQDLSMMRTQLVKRLNEQVGALVITEVRIY